ncbi:hypothetical protein MTO96_021404 [Rhipicephalus appendiculatus]
MDTQNRGAVNDGEHSKERKQSEGFGARGREVLGALTDGVVLVGIKVEFIPRSDHRSTDGRATTAAPTAYKRGEKSLPTTSPQLQDRGVMLLPPPGNAR